MSGPVSWLIIGLMSLSFVSCGLFSYFGTTVSTTFQNYPRVVRTASSGSGSTGFIRNGSLGSSGSSILGGGPSSGK
jgi:hypothetical protein